MKNLRDRGRSRRSIKTRLTAVVLFSNAALVSMWAVVSLPALYDAIYLHAVNSTVEEVLTPAVESLAAVQEERRLSMLYLSPEGLERAELDAQRKKGDDSVTALRNLVEPLLGQSSDSVREKWAQFDSVYKDLSKMRAQIDARQIDGYQAYEYYNKCADVGLDLFDAMARFEPDQEASYSATANVTLFRANDLMSRASTIVMNAFASGALNESDHVRSVQLIGAYHQQFDSIIPYVTGETQARYRAVTASESWKKLVATEQRLISAGDWTVPTANRRAQDQATSPPVSEQDWAELTSSVSKDLYQVGMIQTGGVVDLGISKANSALVKAILGSVVALLVAIGASIAASRVTKTISRRLNQLRDDTLELADERLPEIVEQLRRGEKVDVATQVPTLDHGADEIGQVADAFNTAQATAVAAAVQESQAREGVSTVFLGIAHRSQALVHRQLKILDELEREQEDAQQLDALFRLDHLATRARRNAENLIILGGGQPGRKWRKPVLLADILRSATAETEHYARVRMQGIPKRWLAGAAVADMVHLVSELLDNATSFSPPRSQVRLSAEVAARGVVVEVEDNGLGMSVEDRDRANKMLADPPEFDAMALRGDSRLGLFVVARIAAKHGVKVELRSSSYGGTRAIVLIPSAVLTTEQQEYQPDDEAGDAEAPTALLPLAEPTAATAPPQGSEVERMHHEEVRRPFSLFEPAEGFGNRADGREQEQDSRSAQSSSTSLNSALSDFWAESVAASIAEEDKASSDRAPRPVRPSDAGGEPQAGRRRADERAAREQPAWPAAEPVDSARERPAPRPAQQAAPAPNVDVPPPLPRRRRQANLAPQLKDSDFVPDESDGPGDGRSPEEIRDMMSSFQHNSYRARLDEGTEER